jgi:hypothetical protein
VNIVISNWPRPLWEGDWEVVKRSDRNEPIWIVIHICMITTLGISLDSYVYLKLAKTLCFSYYLLCFLFNKIREQEQNKFCLGVQGLGRQITYTHVSTCKNNLKNPKCFIISSTVWKICNLFHIFINILFIKRFFIILL